MGWETFALVGARVAGAAVTNRQNNKIAKANANATVAQAGLDAENAAHDTVRDVGKLTTSFLNAGISLDGGPNELIARSFKSGNERISRIVGNANTQSKNIISQARSKAIENLISSVSQSFAGANIGQTVGNFASDFSGGIDAMGQGSNFGTGWDLSQSMRNNPDIF